jgi:hypothetical protein
MMRGQMREHPSPWCENLTGAYATCGHRVEYVVRHGHAHIPLRWPKL